MAWTIDSKIQIITTPTPPALPGTCVVCGWSGPDSTQGHRNWLDIGLQVDYVGAIYFCELCVREMSEAIGYVASNDLHESHLESIKLATELHTIREERDKLQEELNGYRKFLSNSVLSADTSLPDGSYVEPEILLEQSARKSDESSAPERDGVEETSGSAKSGTRKKSNPIKSNSQRGYKDVQRDAGDDDDISELLADSG